MTNLPETHIAFASAMVAGTAPAFSPLDDLQGFYMNGPSLNYTCDANQDGCNTDDETIDGRVLVAEFDGSDGLDAAETGPVRISVLPTQKNDHSQGTGAAGPWVRRSDYLASSWIFLRSDQLC